MSDQQSYESGHRAQHEEHQPSVADHGALFHRLRSQVEFYFSPQNLSRDTYLRSVLTSSEQHHEGTASPRPLQLMAPTATILGFPKVRTIIAAFGEENLSESPPLLLKRALEGSGLVATSADGVWIGPSSQALPPMGMLYQHQPQQQGGMAPNSIGSAPTQSQMQMYSQGGGGIYPPQMMQQYVVPLQHDQEIPAAPVGGVALGHQHVYNPHTSTVESSPSTVVSADNEMPHVAAVHRQTIDLTSTVALLEYPSEVNPLEILTAFTTDTVRPRGASLQEGNDGDNVWMVVFGNEDDAAAALEAARTMELRGRRIKAVLRSKLQMEQIQNIGGGALNSSASTGSPTMSSLSDSGAAPLQQPQQQQQAIGGQPQQQQAIGGQPQQQQAIGGQPQHVPLGQQQQMYSQQAAAAQGLHGGYPLPHVAGQLHPHYPQYGMHVQPQPGMPAPPGQYYYGPHSAYPAYPPPPHQSGGMALPQQHQAVPSPHLMGGRYPSVHPGAIPPRYPQQYNPYQGMPQYMDYGHGGQAANSGTGGQFNQQFHHPTQQRGYDRRPSGGIHNNPSINTSQSSRDSHQGYGQQQHQYQNEGGGDANKPKNNKKNSSNNRRERNNSKEYIRRNTHDSSSGSLPQVRRNNDYSNSNSGGYSYSGDGQQFRRSASGGNASSGEGNSGTNLRQYRQQDRSNNSEGNRRKDKKNQQQQQQRRIFTSNDFPGLDDNSFPGLGDNNGATTGQPGGQPLRTPTVDDKKLVGYASALLKKHQAGNAPVKDGDAQTTTGGSSVDNDEGDVHRQTEEMEREILAEFHDLSMHGTDEEADSSPLVSVTGAASMEDKAAGSGKGENGVSSVEAVTSLVTEHNESVIPSESKTEATVNESIGSQSTLPSNDDQSSKEMPTLPGEFDTCVDDNSIGEGGGVLSSNEGNSMNEGTDESSAAEPKAPGAWGKKLLFNDVMKR